MREGRGGVGFGRTEEVRFEGGDVAVKLNGWNCRLC